MCSPHQYRVFTELSRYKAPMSSLHQATHVITAFCGNTGRARSCRGFAEWVGDACRDLGIAQTVCDANDGCPLNSGSHRDGVSLLWFRMFINSMGVPPIRWCTASLANSKSVLNLLRMAILCVEPERCVLQACSFILIECIQDSCSACNSKGLCRLCIDSS